MTYQITESGKLSFSCEQTDDMCEPYSMALVIETEEGADLTDCDEQDLRSDLERRCYCEGDCCGHYFGGVNSITKVWPGRYVVLASYSRNY